MTASIYNPRGIRSAWIKPVVSFPLRLIGEREYRRLNSYFYRLRRKPRFERGDVRYDKARKIMFCDAASFLSAFDEIFVNRIYDIGEIGAADRPYFIDAGANIGLASMYWTSRYPGCEGVAFEPDKEIFRVLQANLAEWHSSIRPICAAVSKDEGELVFESEGADAGRLATAQGDRIPGTFDVTVTATRLSGYLDRRVDLLKVDVEGSEMEVLREIEDKLHLVRRIFVEAHSYEGRKQDFGEVISLLQDNGYRCNVQVANSMWNGFTRLPSATKMDLNLNIYGLRE